MDVTTITMDPAQAQAKLQAFRKALGKRHSKEVAAEWSAAAAAYAELAKGTPLIDPIAAIGAAGWKADGYPRLAIGRADQRFVYWERRTHAPDTNWTFTAMRQKDLWRNRQTAANLKFTVEGNKASAPSVLQSSGVAMVPMVPPDVLPERGCDLSKHFILWEVDSWKAAPPKDPMLLKPIGGDLYAVIAHWDLTPLEMAIIAGTRRQ